MISLRAVIILFQRHTHIVSCSGRGREGGREGGEIKRNWKSKRTVQSAGRKGH